MDPGASCTCGNFFGALVRPLRDIGSSEMILGFGSGIEATSSMSMKCTLVSVDDTGDMVVGFVILAVNMYAIVPRSNCGTC